MYCLYCFSYIYGLPFIIHLIENRVQATLILLYVTWWKHMPRQHSILKWKANIFKRVRRAIFFLCKYQRDGREAAIDINSGM